MMRTLNRRTPLSGTVLLLIAMLFAVFPLLSMLSAALQPQGSLPLGISWPTHPQWHNFVDAWNAANITTLLKSSVLLVLGVVPVGVLLAALAGYAMAQLRIPGRGIFFALLMLGLTLPFEATVVPLYYQLRDMGLLNSRLGLILPLIGLNMPFAVYWMRAHFDGMPAELSESANVDGANAWQTFWRIHVPLAVPAITSLAVLMFLSTWNQFLLAIVLIDDPAKRTMAGALQNFVGQHSTDVVLLNAGALLIMAPTIAVFLAFQRYFVRALISGAVKG